MKGIILAGGMGSRLLPLTHIINKFLLPIYNRPLIEYSVDTFKNAGITDIAVILGKKSAGQTIEYLQSGAKFGVKFTYLFQDEPLGVAHALSYAEDFVGNSPVMVLCADNIIFDDVTPFKEQFQGGCFISCKKFDDVETLKKFAIVSLDSNSKPTHLVEKPTNPETNIAFAGIQIYEPHSLFEIIKGLTPSARGEYEITHVINEYIKRDKFNYGFLDDEWVDAGTPDSLLEAQKIAFARLQK